MIARQIERTREETGTVLGAITDEELMTLAQIRQRNGEIRRAHDLGRFNGDALLFAATESRRDGAATVQLWDGYVSGAITEIRLPCTHQDVVRPDMLAQVWSAISAHLGLEHH